MISISATTSDINGNIVLPQYHLSSNSLLTLYDMERRGRRIPTLDGKAILVDTGISVSDLTLKIQVIKNYTKNNTIIRYLAKNYRYVIISTALGLFKAVISKIKGNAEGFEVEILIMEQLN